MSLKFSLSMMVVDDMTVSRCLVEQALDEIGIQKVQYENSGEVALRKLASNPVHLVLSDFNMPGMDGLSLLEALRMNRSTQRIGFILMTGRASKEIITRGHSLGMNNFISKPFTTLGLKVCIEKVVGTL
ncbi:response regulator [Rhodobacter sp. HX-7-19]|jgi:two-component system chemotaxis response regulator CheY|uniref:Response regulator n=1 Tax=Paragemmobacter kunshanensis TaxID=2583234 RepID=A0A6M1TNR6_9RHOB|nr:response regulator [Rhodobacter kunshanensis]NGQ89470.1 response regulator [Rhodobacter kunshanensis]